MSTLAAYLNDANQSSSQIGRLADLRVGVSYEIVKFDKINTKYGKAIIAHIRSYVGPTQFEDEPNIVFLPNRFTDMFTKEIIDEYDVTNRKIALLYKGIKNRRYDLEFF